MTKRISICLLFAFICAMSALMLFACNDVVNPSSIGFTRQELEIFKGGGTYLELDIAPTNANGFRLEWSSSNEAVATVKKNGWVTAKDYGSAVISCAVKDTDLVARCSVTVTDGQVYSVYIDDSNVKKTYYVGQSFDSRGLIVWGRHESGVDKELDKSEYTIEVPDSLEQGDCAVVRYKNKSYTIELEVLPDVASGIVVTKNPDKMEYIIGEAFDETGMEVAVVYASGKQEAVADFEVEGAVFGANSNMVTVTCGDFTTEFEVIVRAKTIVYNFGQLQAVIDKAEVGDSILLAGVHENVDTITLPLEKNLTIVGGLGGDVGAISPKQGQPIFEIVGDESSGGSVTLANFNFVAQEGQSQPLVTINGQDAQASSAITFENVNFVYSESDITESAAKSLTFCGGMLRKRELVLCSA